MGRKIAIKKNPKNLILARSRKGSEIRLGAHPIEQIQGLGVVPLQLEVPHLPHHGVDVLPGQAPTRPVRVAQPHLEVLEALLHQRVPARVTASECELARTGPGHIQTRKWRRERRRTWWTPGSEAWPLASRRGGARKLENKPEAISN